VGIGKTESGRETDGDDHAKDPIMVQKKVMEIASAGPDS
jgi:hypothetical protein